jgi:hypothetical protein
MTDSTLPTIKLSPNRHFLVTEDGKPFFWLGDTGWNMFHRLTQDEASHYLDQRARQGFNVIQASFISEHDGISANVHGEQALHDEDPAHPNESFFRVVDAYLDLAARRGIYVAALPTWGHRVLPIWSANRAIFTVENARIYGRWLGQRYRDQTNIIWCLGGDRPAVHEGVDYRPVWRAMAQGIRQGGSPAPFTYHPMGGKSSADWLNDEDWLDIHMIQSGHGEGPDVPTWDRIEYGFNLKPVRPILDGEPNYEDHPISPWPAWTPDKGYYRDFDVRKQCYRSVFAGGCGVTYGHQAIWQFNGPRYAEINHPDRTWLAALTRPAAEQVIHLRRLIESRPCLERLPDQDLLAAVPAGKAEHVRALRDASGSYAMIYLPSYQSVTLKTRKISGAKIKAWWVNPRSGNAAVIGEFANTGELCFTTPLDGPDWVLVIDDASLGYAAPGA